MRRSVAALLLSATALTPALAGATEVAVPMLVASGGDQKKAAQYTASISSELDFMGEFTGATELTDPKGFGASCLGSGTCLAKVAAQAGCDATVAGAVSSNKGQLDFYLVYADGAKIVRTKEFSVEDSPAAVADTLSSKLRELITGESAEAAAVAAAGTVDEGAFDEGFDDDFAVVAPVSPSRRIPTNSSGGSDELDDFSLDEEDDSRRGGAVVAPVPAREPAPPPPRREPEPAPPPPPPPAEEEFSFSLGGGVVSAEEALEEDEDDNGGGGAIVAAGYGSSSGRDASPSRSPSRESAPARDASPRRDASPSRPERTRPAPRPRDDYDSLDGGGDSSSSARVSRSPAAQGEAPTVTVAGRLGYSRFQTYNFVTYGVEIGVHPIDNLKLMVGAEAYSVRRDVPQDLQARGAPPVVWNSILPINVGAAYQFIGEMARPYVGGDLLIIPGYVAEASGPATGLRFRGGSDFMLSENFGLNVNLAVGLWSGEDFEKLEADFNSSAMVPQLSTGLVVAF